MMKTAYSGLMVGLTIAGLVAVGWGAQEDSVFLTSVGGAVFGATLGILVAELNARSALADVRALVARDRGSEFTSPDEEIQGYRGVWHHYHRTILEGQLVWRYRRYDFREGRFPGILLATILARDAKGNSYVYDTRAGVRGQRFVMFETARSGKEPVIVEVYPRMGLDFLGIHCGIGLIQAWSGDDLLTPCMMSKNRVVEWTEEDNVSPDYFDELNAAWERGFQQVDVCPVASSSGAD